MVCLLITSKEQEVHLLKRKSAKGAAILLKGENDEEKWMDGIIKPNTLRQAGSESRCTKCWIAGHSEKKMKAWLSRT